MLAGKKQRAATLSVGLNIFLILLKLVVGIISGSIAVIASAIDSFIDLIASLFAFFAVHISDTPPDKEHPFGHGKFEDFSGLIEAVMIMVGAFVIIWQASIRLIHPEETVVEPMLGIMVMVFALILDFTVSRYLFKVAKETESPALMADAYHLSTDVWSSLAVIGGLVLVQITGIPAFDSVMALVVAILILLVGFRILKTVFNHLMDVALPTEEEQQILDIIKAALPSGEPSRVSALRTRRAGSQRLIVFNLLVSPQLSVEKAHEYCDKVEAAIEDAFPNCIVNIHLEPLGPETKGS
jgi:cation diffusion facilitator family transporter